MKQKLANRLGWNTNRKIVIIESDDWGSFRFKNKNYRDKFLNAEQKHKCWMSYYDTFESASDLQNLFEVLESVKDKTNHSAKFTFLMNPSNPDFKKIKEVNFQKFHSETFLETLKQRKDGDEIYTLYQKALKKNILEVGFHGREHLNVNQWMKDLQNKDKTAHLGFENKTWGFSKAYVPDYKKSYRSTYNIQSYEEFDSLKVNVKEGVSLINKIFNQNTTYFLPPDGPYHLALNQTLADNGLKYIGLAKLHNNPLEQKWYQKKLFWLGKQTKEGLTVITRNVMFEPGSPRQTDWVASALQQMQKAFKYNKPAVISSHRANYVSGLDVSFRDQNLKLLNDLICKIIKTWPEVEFMTSSELGVLLRNS
ncbi:polysaccharide (de)acetylase [Psychroflexus sp. MES1-P1E]|uniref:polysaccharide (de)acetylase n=1 Tax=Psychroflexus sp. MES1-P1E TaxID=2058320 RepID=UPI000C7A29CA|nr:polysaccharide (de)acetylase [Psychroflexus sp. MES1-P1E]PKG43428.1 polysaccharide (de)acetylase [Psychroflexus sp. MES1-P1E]